MAGRGRGATLPSWMTSGGASAVPAVVPTSHTAEPSVQPKPAQFAEPSRQTSSDSRDRGRRRDDAPPARRSSRSRSRLVNFCTNKTNFSTCVNNAPRINFQFRDRGRDGGRDRERDRGGRRRSPSPVRGGGGGGGGGHYGNGSAGRERSNPNWRPRKKVSNFDVRPPDGVELPPIGVSATVNGVPNSYFSFSNNPLALAGEIASATNGKVDPPRYVDNTASGGSGATKVDLSANTRHARRIYAGGIPQRVTEQEIVDFFNRVVTRGLYPMHFETPPVIKAYLNIEKAFAFVELTSMELASACMALDGVRFDHFTGPATLRVRRPNDYRPELVPKNLGPIPEFRPEILSEYGAAQPSGPGKLFVGGVPHNLGEEQILELLSTCGKVKAFNLVRDPGQTTSKGYCFCEYTTLQEAEFAIQVLNDMVVGDRKLTVRFSQVAPPQGPSHLQGQQQPMGMALGNQNPLLAMAGFMNQPNLQQQTQQAGYFPGVPTNDFGAYGQPAQVPPQQAMMPGYSNGQLSGTAVNPHAALTASVPTRVLKMSNMVTREDLENDAEFFDIREDVRLECEDHGRVMQVIIPRSKDGFPPATEGNIFVEFADVPSATKAAFALNGKKFAERTVVVQYVRCLSLLCLLLPLTLFLFLFFDSMTKCAFSNACCSKGFQPAWREIILTFLGKEGGSYDQ